MAGLAKDGGGAAALWQELRQDEQALERSMGVAASLENAEDLSAAATGASELLLRAEGVLSRLRQSGEAQPQLDAATARLEALRAMARGLRDRAERGRLLGQERGRGRGAPASQDQSDAAALKALSEARQHMGSTLEHIQQVQKRLDDTSATIASTQKQYDVYGFRMRDAAALLGQLKRRTEEDTKYIWWSFWFFIAVCAYIILRRLRVFKMIWFGVSTAAWTGSNAAGAASGLAGQAAAAYRGFCEMFGIPNMLDVSFE